MLDSKKFIKPEQTGFRKNCRTADHIFVVKTFVYKYVQNCKNDSKLYACYTDMNKAFDTIWHDALFLKLQKADISDKIYNLIKSMYSNSRSRVKCKHVLSNSITISQGVYQGSVLSPLLFNIFINDIGDAMSEQDAPLLLDHRITHLLYADDYLLLSTTHTLGKSSNRSPRTFIVLAKISKLVK